MKKRFLLSMMALASLCAGAQECAIGGLKYAVTDAKLRTAQVVDEVSGSDATSYVIPATVSIDGADYTVTSIGESAFAWSEATSVTLPETVDTLYYGAFRSSGLASVSLPEGLKYIGDYAFNSTKLTSIEIPASVEAIGNSAFFTCNSLASVKFGEGLKTIGTSAFYKCPLTGVTLPQSLEKLGAKAFLNCAKLETVKLPSGLAKLDDGTFNGCASLKSVELPAALKAIGDEVFCNCSALAAISIPAGVDTIGTGVIARTGVAAISVDAANKSFHVSDGCLYSADNRMLYAVPMKGTDKVNVSIRCIGINGGAFWGSEVKRVTLPKGMLAIDDYAFCQSALETVNFPASLVYIGEQGFADTKLSGELRLPDNMPYILDGAFAGNKNVTSVVIPSAVKAVYPHAFNGCTALASVTCLGSSAPSIEDVYEEYDNPFYNCPATTVVVPSGSASSYRANYWSDYFTIDESGAAVFKYESTSPADGSFYTSKWAEMVFDVVFSEPVTIVKSTPEAFLRVGGELGGTVLEPDDCWNATTGGNKNTLRVWGSDYDMYTMSFQVDPEKTYTMVIPAGVVKNAAGELNERIVINVKGSNPTAVDFVPASGASAAGEVARYGISGQRVGKGHKGLTIVRKADGTAVKAVVR